MAVQKVLTTIFHLLGIRFSFNAKVHKKHIWTSTKFVFQLHLIFFIFDSILIFLFFQKGTQTSINICLNIIQCVLPQFIHVFVLFQAYKFRKLQSIIEKNVIKMDLILKLSKSDKKRSTESLSSKFVISLLILIVTRILKVGLMKSLHGRIYALSMMIPELIYSSNDLYFAMMVKTLASRIKFLNQNIKLLNNLDENQVVKIKKVSMKFFAHSKIILAKFSLCLFITISYHVVLTIINLYWLFIRVSFGRLNQLQGDIEFLFSQFLNGFHFQIQLHFCILFSHSCASLLFLQHVHNVQMR